MPSLPFLSSSEPWRWSLREASDLAGATVNAGLVSLDANGARLVREGDRPISVITRPLNLSNKGRFVSVKVALPGNSNQKSVRTKVHLFWQAEPAAGFDFYSRIINLDSRSRTFFFSLPAPALEMHRIGVQFPEITDQVIVESIGIPDPTLAQRFLLAWQEATSPEPIENYSINFRKGPVILGHGFNYYLVSIVAASVGLYVFVRAIRRRPVCYRFVFGIILAIWLVADAQATLNLVRHAKKEFETFRNSTPTQQIAIANYSDDIAWAYEQLLQHTEPGTDFVVIGGFGPVHRLAYLLAPHRTKRDAYEDAEFLVVIRASDVSYDPQGNRFRLADGPWVRVEKVAVKSSFVYLLRRRTQ